MRMSLIVLVVLGVLLSFNGVYGQSPSPSASPSIQFSSLTYPSVPYLDKPVIWVITTQSLTEPARVSWQTVGVSGAGSFNKISDTKWFCFFSTDATSTCGTSPFTGAGATSVSYIIRIKSPQLTADTGTNSVTLSSINTQPVTYDSGSKTAYMLSSEFDSNTATVTYSILSAADLSEVRRGDTNYTLGKGFNIDFSSNPLSFGKYFVVFDLTKKSDQKKGGSVAYFEIAGGASPGPISPTKTGGLDADSVIVETTANQSETIESQQFTIRNPFNQPITNLTASLPSSLTSFIQINFLTNNIDANGTAKYTIKIPDVQSNFRLDNKFNITGLVGGNATTVEVPLRIKVDVIIPQKIIVDSEKPLLDLSPTFFSEKLIIGRGFNGKIIVKNLGKGKLGGFSVEHKGISKDLVKVGLPSQELQPGAQGSILLNASPATEQRYTGSLVIKTNGGEKEVWIDLEAFEDASSNIDVLQSRVNTKVVNVTGKGFTDKEAKDLFSGVIADLSTARSDWDAGKYADAKISYKLAEGKLTEIEAVLASGKKSAGGDSGGILLPIIIVVIVLVVVVIAFKKLRSAKTPPAEEYGEEEYKEGEYSEGEK